MAHEWAPIVYGRTYWADYRTKLLAVPEGFDSTQIEWAGSWMGPGRTSQGEHWLVFGNAHHRVVALACPAFAADKDRCRDEKERMILVVLGWCCRAPFPPLPPRDPKLFYPLYAQCVLPRWRENPRISLDWTNAVHRPYSESLPAIEVTSASLALNVNPNTRLAWPNQYDANLWAAASREPSSVSLALGFSDLGALADRPFLNATVKGVDSIQTITPSPPRPTDKKSSDSAPPHQPEPRTASASETQAQRGEDALRKPMPTPPQHQGFFTKAGSKLDSILQHFFTGGDDPGPADLPAPGTSQPVRDQGIAPKSGKKRSSKSSEPKPAAPPAPEPAPFRRRPFVRPPQSDDSGSGSSSPG